MKIKTGDQVKILSGKDKNKTGKVLQVFPKSRRASIEGLNLLIKHLRPRRRGEPGQRVEFPAPLALSKLMLVCSKCGRPTRVRYQFTVIEGQRRRKNRVCAKCGVTID